MAGSLFDGDGDQDLAAVSGSRAGVVLLKGPFTRAGGRAGWQSLGDGYGYLDASQVAAGRVTADAATDLYILGRDLHGDDDLDLRVYFHRGGSDFTRRAGETRVPDDGGHQMGSGPVTTVGDFDKDGYGDLAIGRGYEQPDRERGYVTVQYGGPFGPNTAREAVKFTQDTVGVPGASENEDFFGAAVSAGDVNENDLSAAALASERPLAGSRAVRAADLRRVGVRSEGRGFRLHAAFARQGLPKLGLQVILAVLVRRQGRALGVSRLGTFLRWRRFSHGDLLDSGRGKWEAQLVMRATLRGAPRPEPGPHAGGFLLERVTGNERALRAWESPAAQARSRP